MGLFDGYDVSEKRLKTKRFARYQENHYTLAKKVQ